MYQVTQAYEHKHQVNYTHSTACAHSGVHPY